MRQWNMAWTVCESKETETVSFDEIEATLQQRTEQWNIDNEWSVPG